jgi:hypothetical protein
VTNTPRLKKQRALLFKLQEGKCFWCQQLLVVPVQGRKTKRPPANEATIDHLDSRLSGERGMHRNEFRHVLACRTCNEGRAAKEVSSLPREELWQRSGSYPREFGVPDRRDIVRC